MAFMDDPGKTKMFGKIEKEDRAALPLSPIVSDASPTKFFFSGGFLANSCRKVEYSVISNKIYLNLNP